MAESWINITVGGAAAGGAVAALTYATTLASTKALATGTSISFNVLGELAGYGATYFSGSAAGMSIRIMAHTAGKASEEAIRSSGYLAAAGAATVAGALTALTITVGTKAVQYSVEYGGKITNEMAYKISEAYLKYRLQNTEQIELTEINDKDWVILQLPNGAPVTAE
jgi:hypothetical protein